MSPAHRAVVRARPRAVTTAGSSPAGLQGVGWFPECPPEGLCSAKALALRSARSRRGPGALLLAAAQRPVLPALSGGTVPGGTVRGAAHSSAGLGGSLPAPAGPEEFSPPRVVTGGVTEQRPVRTSDVNVKVLCDLFPAAFADASLRV